MIQKKKSPLPIIIVIAAILIIGAVVCYFSFFSEAAIRDREIKAHITSAEKYLDDLDYENAIAEYEAALKLSPDDKDILDDYIDTVLAYADEIGADNPDKAIGIIDDAISFLEKLDNDDGIYDEYIEKIKNEQDKYKKDDVDEAEEKESEDDDLEIIPDEPDVNYTIEEIVLDDIVGDGWEERYITADNTIICLRSQKYGDDYSETIYSLDFEFYDFSGELLNKYSFGTSDYENYENYVVGWSCYKFSKYHGDVGFVVYICSTDNHTLYLYDFSGNQIKSVDVIGWGNNQTDFGSYLVNNFAFDYATALWYEEIDDDNYIQLDAKSDWEESAGYVPALYLDCTTLELKYPSEVELNIEPEPEYDSSIFSYCSRVYTDNDEITYFVKTVEGEWGYTDESFEIIALYEDATNFNKDGFALVTEDGSHYDLIDCYLNVVEESIFVGDSASLYINSNIFRVANGEDNSYYLIEEE